MKFVATVTVDLDTDDVFEAQDIIQADLSTVETDPNIKRVYCVHAARQASELTSLSPDISCQLYDYFIAKGYEIMDVSPSGDNRTYDAYFIYKCTPDLVTPGILAIIDWTPNEPYVDKSPGIINGLNRQGYTVRRIVRTEYNFYSPKKYVEAVAQCAKENLK